MILLPTLMFIIAQYLLSGVIIGDSLTTKIEMTIVGFTWISALMVIPISFQMYFKITSNTNKNRSKENVSLYKHNLYLLLIIEVAMLICSLLGHFIANYFVSYDYIQWIAMGIQLAFIFVIIVLPIVFLEVVPKVSDKGYKTTKIVTIILVSLINAAILALFIVDIVVGYFLS